MEPLDLWLTVAVLAAMLVALVREWVTPAAGTLGALVVLVLVGVVPVEEAFSGFSSSATLTLAGLFVIARALRERGGVEAAIVRSLDGGTSVRGALTRLNLPVAAVSSVVANTPLVAAIAPIVRDWAERRGHAPSHYLMPLSFATILGGTLTVIGTSPTLLASGLLERATGRPLGLLEVTPIALPGVLVGLVIISLLAPRVLPDRRTSSQQVRSQERQYTLPLAVAPGSPVAGRTVQEAGLRDLGGTFLARIVRSDGEELSPVPPDAVVHEGDLLVFVGEVTRVGTLAATPGLRSTQDRQVSLLDGDQHDLVEVVLGRASPLVGRTLKEVSFRGRYGAVVLAMHRSGERVADTLGQVRLEPGDSLLVQAGEGFVPRWRDGSDFAVVAPLGDPRPTADRRRGLVLGTTLAMVVAAASGQVPVLLAVLTACLVLLGTGTLRFGEAKEALDLDVLLVVASAIGIGAAVERSGLAGAVADGVLAVGPAGGDLQRVVTVAVLVLATMVLTELVTNVAAVALMVPIALDLAEAAALEPRRLVVAVAIGASASFLTPIGYQTNTIVHGLGGYRFGDYWRLGAPLSATILVATVTTVTWLP